MPRFICITRKVKTRFGSLFLHFDQEESGRGDFALSYQGRHDNTTLGTFVDAINEAIERDGD